MSVPDLSEKLSRTYGPDVVVEEELVSQCRMQARSGMATARRWIQNVGSAVEVGKETDSHICKRRRIHNGKVTDCKREERQIATSDRERVRE